MKKKVLFYNGSLRMGGIERVLVEVLQNIDKNQMDIDLVIEDGTETLNVFEKDIPKEIEIFYLKSEKLIKITDFFRRKKKNIFYKIAYNLLMNYESYIKKSNLKKLVKNKKYDVVIDFDMGLSKYVKMIDVNKKIAWIHASIKNWYEKESRIARLGRRLQQYNNIVTICDEMKEETANLFPFLKDKLLRIYNPFNFNRILTLSEENVENIYYKENFIIAIARLTTHQKDFSTLIKAFKRAKELGRISEKLLILGDGPDREKIEKMIRDENMEKDIILLGSIKNPYPWLKKAKIFVHSSKYEGLPTVLIEALILNKKVISSACPTGPREILENGKIGDLYEIGDYEKLAYYIVEALKNDSLDKKLIEKEIQKFSKEVVIKDYEKLILN
ncbi:glycosyltransferase [Fusobacterium canifelinum]|uniref:Glycosyltransferase n=1 Tax=Fusobacterium canifelinum TaxID=285729 RepID=A0A3P1V023_9FUSO|nr:glycosyltransferase [Fusobacterium canifelinum]QQB72909.1 glycosyltransferase [Fusobacterium canifelinum]RRD26645.1 glycosyltransferase [Fusobacterium canifelinum]